MNNKALLGTIFLILAIFIILILLFGYFKIRTTGLQLSAGNIIINIKYNDSIKGSNNIKEDTEINESNNSLSIEEENIIINDSSNFTYENLTNQSQ